ncbi:MAG: hypothetical protein JWQ99_1169 [Blastococcus sp.]|jgi:hypothetical protein|nr:hypothetical protein [Blastococcus sp.]
MSEEQGGLGWPGPPPTESGGLGWPARSSAETVARAA